MTEAIRAEGLVKNFGKTRALAGADLSAQAGTVLGVLGPNGAGKTTAVRILTTLLPPDGGTATVGGYDVVTDAHRVRQLIGLTGQYASVDDGLSGTNNLVMIGRLLGLSRADAKARARELLAKFGLTEAGGRPVKTYSGGMRRRVDLAASLVGRPQVLFLDEPTTGLDPQGRSEVWDTIRMLVSDGVTVLLTTQYLDEADQLADDIVVIDHGRVIATGTPDELKAKVGGQVLEVEPADQARLGDVAAVLASWTGDEPVAEPGAKLVAAQLANASVLPGIVRQLDDEGIELAEFSLRKSSLDEVFLTLTGHRAEDEATASGLATERDGATR
ncbi:MAG TPA: ATP-binding cassette domain-containing protein [Streptosporangiaceae bacterium]|nr:ATP-binding cassette domain-containing protein [Streptosporangiaceae bacterium]